MKVKITHEPEERAAAELLFQIALKLFPRSRVHETQQDGRRVLYLTSKRTKSEPRETANEQRANREKTP